LTKIGAMGNCWSDAANAATNGRCFHKRHIIGRKKGL
jgi:hypothetical protein